VMLKIGGRPVTDCIGWPSVVTYCMGC